MTDADAWRMKDELARREGLLVGISAGAAVHVALEVARRARARQERRDRPARHGRALLQPRGVLRGGAAVSRSSSVAVARCALASCSSGLGGLGCPAALALARAGVGVARPLRRRRGRAHEPPPADPLRRGRRRARPRSTRGRAIAPSPGVRAPAARRRGCACTATRLLPAQRAVDSSATTTSCSRAATTSRRSSWPPTPALWRGFRSSTPRRFAGSGRRSPSAPGGAPLLPLPLRGRVPAGDAPNCAEAGVMGPVVGVVAAAQVDLALALLDGTPASGTARHLRRPDRRAAPADDRASRRVPAVRRPAAKVPAGSASSASTRRAMFRPRARAERREEKPWKRSSASRPRCEH